jgi:hypothetical protein
MACQYDNPMPELTLSPQSGSMNSDTVVLIDLGLDTRPFNLDPKSSSRDWGGKPNPHHYDYEAGRKSKLQIKYFAHIS